MVKGKSNIHFHLLYPFKLPNRVVLKSMIRKIYEQEHKNLGEVNIIFCDDKYLLGINKEFLKHDYYTDIITFPLHKEDEPIEADIFISIERVKENAKTLQLKFIEELFRVIIHGNLHLCGYGDKTTDEIATMRSRENFYLKELGFT